MIVEHQVIVNGHAKTVRCPRYNLIEASLNKFIIACFVPIMIASGLVGFSCKPLKEEADYHSRSLKQSLTAVAKPAIHGADTSAYDLLTD